MLPYSNIKFPSRKLLKLVFTSASNNKTLVQCKKHTMSHYYRPANVSPTKKENSDKKIDKSRPSKTEPISKSQRLMIDNGLIHLSSASGTYHLLPLAMKSLEKLISIIDYFMGKIDCQKIRMPILASSDLWTRSGRLEEGGAELMKMRDRHSHELILNPTHEEVICDLISSQAVSYNLLPLRLYQITDKFRDERRPRFGLIRGREFIMKDLYTFDTDEKSARLTYEEVNKLYSELFQFIGVKWIKAFGSTGIIGGNLSHEFHLISDNIGEDILFICNECKTASNQETLTLEEGQVKIKAEGGRSHGRTLPKGTPCPYCGCRNLIKSNAIEVGHSFLLGTKYTGPFQTSFTSSSGNLELLHMGCYGIGVSRLLAATVEVLSTPEEIRWPLPFAPYLLCVIPPKDGSIEASLENGLSGRLINYLSEILPDDVIVDDRTDLTIGKRLKDLKKLGIPFAVILGKQLRDEIPKVEVLDVYNAHTQLFNKSEIFGYLNELKDQWKFL